MITMLNDKSSEATWSKYNVLFKKAWKELLEYPDGTLLKPLDKDAADNGKEAFADLAHYFAYIEQLINIDPIYLMLPIDETPFEIDANTRKIDTKDFAKYGGVQSDNYAEIITFTIDRYFDYKDLDQAEIAVQWANGTTEGVSFIQLKDLETYGAENKIRFGWPLTAEMTAAAGTLRFAVRFYTAKKVDGNLQFEYILNTTEASIPIKPTLNVDFNGVDTIRKDNDYTLFKTFVTNSSNPSYGIPTDVNFVIEDDEFPQYGRIDLDTDTLTLKAQAITKDLNPITYEWYSKEENGELIPIVNNDDYQIDTEYTLYNPTEWPKSRPAMTFWVEEALGSYVRFEEAWPTENPENLFTKKETLTFKADGGDVTGKYLVRGTNANAVNSVYEDSRICTIEAPGDIVITKPLPQHMFLDTNSDTLITEIEKDKTYATSQKVYNVYFSEDSFSQEDIKDMEVYKTSNVTESTTYEYDIESNKFGYYAIKPSTTLNRVTKEPKNEDLVICYVSNKPGAVSGKMCINTQEIDTTSTTGIIDGIPYEWLETTEGETVEYDTIKLNATTLGQEVALSVNRIIENEDKFNTGSITYRWTRTKPDGLPEEILKPSEGASGDIVGIDFITGILSIRAVAPDDMIGYRYSCYITNTIQDKFTESKAFTFIIV